MFIYARNSNRRCLLSRAAFSGERRSLRTSFAPLLCAKKPCHRATVFNLSTAGAAHRALIFYGVDL